MDKKCTMFVECLCLGFCLPGIYLQLRVNKSSKQASDSLSFIDIDVSDRGRTQTVGALARFLSGFVQKIDFYVTKQQLKKNPT